MRAFLAVELDSEVRRRLAELLSELRPFLRKARFVRPDNLHLTLCFLGEVSPETVEAVSGSLEGAASRVRRFEITFRGSGVFPERRRPRVLWAGVADPPRALFELQSGLAEALRAGGITIEERRFEPHLTIARFRGPEKRLVDALRLAENRDFGAVAVRQAVLFESVLSPEGSIYRVVRSFPLRPD